MSEPASEPPVPPMLDYAKRAPLAWVSRRRKLLIVLTLVAAAGIPIYRNWASLKHRALWIYWSRQAARHVMPPPGPTSVSDAVEAKQMAAKSEEYLLRVPSSATTQPWAWYLPVSYRELRKVDPRVTLTGAPDGPIIFLGRLHRPDGAPRLAIVAGQAASGSNLLVFVGAVVFPIPRWLDPLPPATATIPLKIHIFSGPPQQAAALRTAAIDPRDASHVIVPYELLGAYEFQPTRGYGGSNPVPGKGEIDFYLQNDDSFRIVQRGPGRVPTTQVAGDPSTIEAEAQKMQFGLQQTTATTRPAAR